MATFIDFRDGSGGAMLRRLGVNIGKLQTWQEYTSAMLGMEDRESFIDRAKGLARECSSAERVIIGAVLFGMDFAWLAAELDGGEFWNRANNFDEFTATAVAAAIMRQDVGEQRAAA